MKTAEKQTMFGIKDRGMKGKNEIEVSRSDDTNGDICEGGRA